MQSLLVFGYLFLISLLLPITCLGMATNNITTDQYALLAFQNHITSDPHRILSSNWSSNIRTTHSSVCEWIGVTCGSRHYRVTALDVSYMGLSGTIPPQLGNLSFLVSLNITGNNFSGELPNELSRLRRLRVLSAGINSLGGEMPSWLGSLHQLRLLSLPNNTFTGSIPTSISNLSKLEELQLSFNSLHGSIPEGIGRLHNLKALVIKSNQISGPIPHGVLNNISSLERINLLNNALSGSLPMSMCSRNRLKKLKSLNLSRNKFSGQIPSGLFQYCSQLQMLSLSLNQFGGFISKEIGSLRLLEELYLGGNNLKGEIPREIGNLTMLKILSIRQNMNLSGVIPSEFGNLYNLEELYLENISLSGPIPVEIFNISRLSLIDFAFNNLLGKLPSNMCRGRYPNLEGLYLNENNLHGALPASISNCSKLNAIELQANKFVGSIPSSLGNLRLLERLDLSNNSLSSYSSSLELLTSIPSLRELTLDFNQLNCQLPESVGNLSSSLESFHAYTCGIKGKIPPGFGNLSRLILLELASNQLTGSIPETIKDLDRLQVLDLQDNELNKAMLNKLCGLPRLAILSLGQNQISELIPECIGNVSSLRSIYLDSNKLTSTVPINLLHLEYLLDLDLSTNHLVGPLPPEIGNLKVAVNLDLSMNNLSGVIPSTIGGIQSLSYVSLAFNRFQGPIPESMGNMLSLETLELSHNNLSGPIPFSFEKLQTLKYLNVSFNDLTGQIPSKGPFENFTYESFISNEALCGPQRFHVPPCPSTPTLILSRKKSRIKYPLRTIVIICVGIAAILGFVAFGLVYLRYRQKTTAADSSGDGLLLLGGHERVSYHELQRATDGYNESNLLGSGAFGSVYRGTLQDGRIVAIKVFKLDLARAFESFDAECQVLRNLRHRNLTKVISSCSAPDFKALVFAFMPNGSLDKWLHYSDNFTLDMKQRLNIMIDVASALQYLHGGYSTPVVHCDLKPSNVLLDQEMVAHVSDFGIAKMLSPEDSSTHTATIATLGYIAPEYGSEGLVSTKCDVYSYGIMLMEVFTSKRPGDERFFNDNISLKDMVQVHNAALDALYQVLDSRLFLDDDDDQHNAEKLECVSSIMEIALSCSRESPNERSNMAQVVIALNNVKTKLISM